MVDTEANAIPPNGARARTQRHDRYSSVLTAIDELSDRWVAQRSDRFARRHLERADFDALAATGYLELIVPESHGGRWRSLPETGPIIADAVGRLARGDQSVALVASMHPTVVGFWTTVPVATGPERDAWAAQREAVFATALDGHFWGTVTSEPGSGGDIMATRAEAIPTADPNRFLLHGDKHFGSGSQIVSYMVTTARPAGAAMPMAFYLDLRDQPWDGTGGITITRPWDGMGMKATQSHAVRFDDVAGTPWAWQQALALGAPAITALGLTTFCSVITSVCDAAMVEAQRRLTGRTLRPYEQVALTQAEIDHWMLSQAMVGAVAALATEPAAEALLSITKAKLGMGALAESMLDRICRAVGGGAFSASSPFATWYEDVRALGYLRPPWALAFDQLSEGRTPPV
jgi:alkylation response protein AidB-like acyl-CoA dehydrogenase